MMQVYASQTRLGRRVDKDAHKYCTARFAVTCPAAFPGLWCDFVSVCNVFPGVFCHTLRMYETPYLENLTLQVSLIRV